MTNVAAGRARRMTPLLALALAATGCAQQPPANAVHDANDASRHPDGLTTPPLRAAAQLTTIQTGGRGARPQPWRVAGVTSDGRTLLVRYLDTCGWLDDASVAEDDGTVTVSVRVAQPADWAPGEVCAAPASDRHVQVALRAPLRERLVLDGADRQPRPVVRLAPR